MFFFLCSSVFMFIFCFSVCLFVVVVFRSANLLVWPTPLDEGLNLPFEIETLARTPPR